ncbi:MAG TPA: cytochrome c biogenesis protein CcdA [Clostridiales bacterium]|nr:cytochrome c biogenesis protein CcdA [Clostridiales bacterium]
MEYLITFLEGIITFISPCLLPMLPIYISYFAGSSNHDKPSVKAFLNAIGFVLGFSLIFMLLGAFAGTIGVALNRHRNVVNILTGLIVILFGLNFMNVIRLPFLNTRQIKLKHFAPGFFSSVLFGMVFSVGWTPCVGAFLGSALMLAASEGQSLKGVLMLLCFSLGLGIPFILSAVLLENLKSVFSVIKRNYRVINLVSGIFLVIVGILMATGLIGRFLALLSF